MPPLPSPTTTWHTTTYPSLSPTLPSLSAHNKTILITGGGTGIGAGTAHYFALAGASRIALLGRREQPLLDTKAGLEKIFAGIEIFVASTDITKQREVDAAFAEFLHGGKIDVLVSNAASLGPVVAVKDADGDKFLDAIQQNLQGSFFVAQAFLRHAAAGAVVINVSSGAAHLNMLPGLASYCISKMAISQLWDAITMEHPDLVVFHVHPGLVDTVMNREAGGTKATGLEDDVSLPASFHVWLASPEARFLRGKFLWANWDVDELKARSDELESNTQLSIGLVGWPFEQVNGKA